MQRSSASIASLASALAKAQIELANPEKSLIGSIETGDRNAPERLFRYASLASGLEIVRKTLGQHEIATVQTTAIDQAAGVVNLTTVLAHASGEWIASDWPVCQISETATPHRMGAALTYARRYALFTLVGIAGEDDLDAPDLVALTNQASGSDKPRGNGRVPGEPNDRPYRLMEPSVVPRNGKQPSQVKPMAMLGAQASAQLRDQLIAELADLVSDDDAALWARRRLRQKHSLTSSDAEGVEERFQTRLASFAEAATPIAETSGVTKRPSDALKPGRRPPAKTKQPRPRAVDKSVLTLPEPRRVRDREHVRHVARQACLVCGRRPCDAHHLRFAQSRALGRKVSDEFTVPLCRGHHRELHRHGDEAPWWRKVAIDPSAAARYLWMETHPRLDSLIKGPLDTKSNDTDNARVGAKHDRSGRNKPKLRNEPNLRR